MNALQNLTAPPATIEGVLPKVYRVNIVEAHERLNETLSIEVFSTQLTRKEACDLLDRLVSISTPYPNAIRLRLLESDAGAGFGGLVSTPAGSTDRIPVLDRLLNLMEFYIAPGTSSENHEIVSRLFKLFGNLGAVDISTRQISRFVQLLTLIEGRAQEVMVLRDFLGGFKRLGRVDPSTLKVVHII